MSNAKGRVDGCATIDNITERHMTLRDWEEIYFLWYRTFSFIQNYKYTLTIIDNVCSLPVSVLLYIILSMLSGTETKFSLFHNSVCRIFWSVLYMTSVTAEYQFSSSSQSEY